MKTHPESGPNFPSICIYTVDDRTHSTLVKPANDMRWKVLKIVLEAGLKLNLFLINWRDSENSWMNLSMCRNNQLSSSQQQLAPWKIIQKISREYSGILRSTAVNNISAVKKTKAILECTVQYLRQ